MFAATASGARLILYVVYQAERLYDRWVSGGLPRTFYNRSKPLVSILNKKDLDSLTPMLQRIKML